MARVPLIFTVNGTEQAEFVEPGALLLDVLRDKLGLTATKSGCNQGTCGACTVLVDGEPRLSCLTPAQRVEGASVRRWRVSRRAASCTRCSAPSRKALPRNADSARPA